MPNLVEAWKRTAFGNAAVLFLLLVVARSPAWAQSFPQSISNFAPKNIDLAIAREVLRTVSELPPVTNVGIAWVYDPQLDAFVPERDNLGSGMVSTARFNRKGSFSALVSFAYFALDEFDGKDSTVVVVDVPADNFVPGPTSPRLTKGIAASVDTEIFVARLAGRYTILDRLDVGLSLPLIVAHTDSTYRAQALQNGDQSQIASFTRNGTRSPIDADTLVPNVALNRLDRTALPEGFNEGSNFDAGNLVLDSKIGFDTGRDDVSLGAQVELRLPTATETRFTGTDTTSLRGLLLASYQSRVLGIYFSGGYEQDFSTEVLSNGSLSASLVARVLPRLNVEVGMNANFYREGIDLFDSGKFQQVLPSTAIVAGDPELGSDEVSFGGGIRFNPFADLAVSAYATMPVNDDGYRPGSVVAVSLDYPL